MKRMTIAAIFALALAGGARADDEKPAEANPKAAAEAKHEAKPDGEAAKFPNLAAAEGNLAKAKTDLDAAEKFHQDKGTLDGHGAAAVKHIDEAMAAVKEAVEFAEKHPAAKGHKPGKETGKVKHHAKPDDKKWENLGHARAALEDADEDLVHAEQVHKTIGALGDHAKTARKHINQAIQEIDKAEKAADKHAAKKK